MKKLSFTVYFILFTLAIRAQNVGIGTVAPATDLHILGASNADVVSRVEAQGSIGSASLQAKGSGGNFDIFQMTKYNASTGGTVAGLNLANLSLLYAGSNAGPMFINVVSANKMYFGTGNNVRATLDATGKFGIGTQAPISTLTVLSTSGSRAFYLSSTAAPDFNGIARIEYNGPTDLNGRIGLYVSTIRTTADVYGEGISGLGSQVGVLGTGESVSGSQVEGTEGDSYASGTYSIGVAAFGDRNGAVSPINCWGLYGYAQNGTSSYAAYMDGNVKIIGSISKGSGTFLIDHPLDPANKYLYHSFVESPDMMNIYNGNITTDNNGVAVVSMPDYFSALNKDFRYQLTVLGSFARAMISKEMNENSFEIKTEEPNVKVSWQVTGVRQDAYANAHRVVPVVEKESYNKGKYLYPKELGMSAELKINGDVKRQLKNEADPAKK